MPNRLKQFLAAFLKLAIGITLLYLALRNIDGKDLARTLKDPIALAINLFFSLIISLLLCYRWTLVCEHLKLTLGLWRAFHTFMVSTFLGSTIFGSFTSDLAKFYLITKDHPENKLMASVSVVLDRIISLFGILSFAALAVLFFLPSVFFIPEIEKFSPLLRTGSFLVLLIFFFIPWMLRWQTLKEITQKFFPRFFDLKKVYADNPFRFHSLVLISIFSSFLHCLQFWTQSGRIGLETSFSQLLIFVPVSSLLSYLSFLPFGLGISQWLFYAFYQGISPEAAAKAVLVTTNIQMGSVVFQLFGIFFYLQDRKEIKSYQKAVSS